PAPSAAPPAPSAAPPAPSAVFWGSCWLLRPTQLFPRPAQLSQILR
ncbi:hypothetical protein A2U01_0071784, partial [Trifolium medium]|nr:hypothetical protein [Trifolium medium]